MYRKVDLAAALTAVFSGWERLACAPSPDERALIAKAIGAARNREPQPPTTATETVTFEIDVALIERARVRVPTECRSTDRATAEHALLLYALDRELIHGDYPGPLTDADARVLLSDELHQTGRVQQETIDQRVTISD